MASPSGGGDLSRGLAKPGSRRSAPRTTPFRMPILCVGSGAEHRKLASIRGSRPDADPGGHRPRHQRLIHRRQARSVLGARLLGVMYGVVQSVTDGVGRVGRHLPNGHSNFRHGELVFAPGKAAQGGRNRRGFLGRASRALSWRPSYLLIVRVRPANPAPAVVRQRPRQRCDSWLLQQ